MGRANGRCRINGHCSNPSCVVLTALGVVLAAGLPLASAQVADIVPTTGPAAPVDEARFTTLHGKPGFWRIGKTHEGVWWFVSPQGHLDFLNTCNTVQPTVRGRDPLGPDFVSRDFDEHDASPANTDRWAKATIARLRDTGFKGVGAWSDPVLHNYDIPMTQDLNLSSWIAAGPQLFFTPAWSANIEKAIKTQVEPLRQNHNLIGYFLDNEMCWDDHTVGPRAYFDDLPGDDPNRQQVLGIMRATWPSLDTFNKEWQTDVTDWSAVEGWRTLPRSPAVAYDRLLDSWLSRVAEMYFQTTTALLHKYDPNHLILGVRYRGNAPREVVRASRGLTDAQSLNYYVSDARLDPNEFKMIATESDQPIVISEYSFHALDGRSGDRNTIGFDAQVLDQKARGDAYRDFTTRLARVPYVIGADWFQWMDEPPSGRRIDGEDVNFGVVDVDDKPYEPLADAIRTTSPALNGLHETSDSDKQQDIWRDSFANRPAFRVPLLEKPIRINGELSYWPAVCKLPGMRAALAVGTERVPLQQPNVYLGWSPQGLSVAFEVFDSDVSGVPASGAWWARDSVEFWVSTRPVRNDQERFDKFCHHFFFVPVDLPAGDGISGVVGQWHSPGDAAGKSLIPHPDIKSVTRILPDRYVTELFLPAKALEGYDPEHQPQLAFNITVRNYQHAAEYFWSAPKQIVTQARPCTWGMLDLTQPSLAPKDTPVQQPVANIVDGK